jgi:hypothetical protein
MFRMHPYLIFRNTTLGEMYGRLGAAPLTALDGARTMTVLHCERAHFAADRGVCLSANRKMLTTYEAIIFDSDFQPLYRLSLDGIPSRVRVAPDGRFAAITVFVSGHSYAAAGFSTRVTIIDLHSGKSLIDDIEKFTVWREGQPFQAVDFNFWGVTFTRDSNQFYATLGTSGQTYLVKGNVAAREAEVLRERIECPSLSPDNTKVAFKKRIDSTFGPVIWRLSILDLATSNEWSLAETHSVDDQVEWLNNDQVLYSLPDETSAAMTNTWVVQADGSGKPHLLVPQAYSPVVVRRAPSTVAGDVTY